MTLKRYEIIIINLKISKNLNIYLNYYLFLQKFGVHNSI
jgi:hypothetical protein